MAYATGNPKTKKELKRMVAEEHPQPMAFSPGPFGCKLDGVEYIEGPHYPQPHKWYAMVEVKGGFIVKVLS